MEDPNHFKGNAVPTKSDMMKAAVTFKDGKAHDVVIDVFGPDYFIKPGVLSSGNQGNWGKVAKSKAKDYIMVIPSADRPADTILPWHSQLAEVTKLYKKTYDLASIPTCVRDDAHPSVIDFNKYANGKYAAYTISTTNGAIDVTKLKGAERSAIAKADAITSVSVDVGKYLKLADDIVKAGTK